MIKIFGIYITKYLVNLLKLNISIIVQLLARNKQNVHNASVSIRTWS